MENLEGAINKFQNQKILVIGDIILDKFSYGITDRLNPESISPLVKIISEEYVLGGAANVANNISSLGAHCILYGTIGGDYEKEIKKLCCQRGIDFFYYQNHLPTIIKQRFISKNPTTPEQQVLRADYGEYLIKKLNSNVFISSFDEQLRENIEEFDFIVLSDYDKQLFTKPFSEHILSLANSYDIPILVDPKPQNIAYFRGCNVICPNKKEAEEITGVKYKNGKDTLIEISSKLAEIVNSKHIFITCGEDGVFGYDPQTKEHIQIETKVHKVADVTGAGDTFSAALTLGLASGLNMHDAGKLANYAAGIIVEKIGTATTTQEELMYRIKQDYGY